MFDQFFILVQYMSMLNPGIVKHIPVSPIQRESPCCMLEGVFGSALGKVH